MAGEVWQQTKVDEMIRRGVLALNDGYRVRNVELGPVGIPFVRGGDIGDGGINTAVEDHIRPEFTDRVQSKLTRPFDVAFITKGTVGRVGMVRPTQPPSVFAPQVCYWRSLDPDQLEPRFLFYLLTSAEFQANLDAVKTHGSMAADYVSMTDQRDFRLTFPPIREQKAIAAVLGALDDKIELNRRMNATLEGIARSLFQSWFVDFDPVRANIDRRGQKSEIGTVKSEMEQTSDISDFTFQFSLFTSPATAALFPANFDHKAEGVVPTGWRSTTLSEVVEIFDSKRIPLSGREREARNGPYPYHGAASVMDYVDDYLFDGIYALMGEDGSVINDDGTPVVQYVWGKFWVNNHAHVLRGKNGICTEHLLLHLKGSNIAAFVTGAVQPKLNQGNLNRIPFMLPPPEIGEAFAKAIEPLFAQIRANTEQSRTLATLRDTLLPKLLSGELGVPPTD